MADSTVRPQSRLDRMYAVLRGFEAREQWRASGGARTYLDRDPCAYCGKYRRKMEWDHIEPRIDGHSLHGNYARCCWVCNRIKNRRPLLAWLAHRARVYWRLPGTQAGCLTRLAPEVTHE